MDWRRIDLHLHTPASADYRDPDATYLKILLKAEERGLDVIAFTDHNTVSGYSQMLEEIEILELLERRGRITEEEAATLAEYRRLRETLLVLPGFEFTATFGFHILGIFPPGTSMRKLELLLLNLKVPEDKMLAGSSNAGATSDVLDAYEAIAEAGGLAIAAHVNSSNGVAMQGFNFGGQTKIAYTQHEALAALEVTDLDQTGRRTTASFFNGSKPEYPRRMHCIQGSDAHSIEREPGDGANKRLGVGDRCTEVLLPEVTFEALRQLFNSGDFDRVRPYRPAAEAFDFVRSAREQGPSIVQAFHERPVSKTSRTRPILRDIAAFANTQGGTIFVGVSPERNVPIRGVERPEEVVQMLRLDAQRSITPPLDIDFHVHSSEGRQVLMVQVPLGGDRPYMYDPTGQIFIRMEGESMVASRDDIVRLVLESHATPGGLGLVAASDVLDQVEPAFEDMAEEEDAGAAASTDAPSRRRRRRRRGERILDVTGPEQTLEELPPAVPAWETTPAFEGPEDDYSFDEHGRAHVVDEDRMAMAMAAGYDLIADPQPSYLDEDVEDEAGVEMPQAAAEIEPEPVVLPAAPKPGRRRRRRVEPEPVAEEPAAIPLLEIAEAGVAEPAVETAAEPAPEPEQPVEVTPDPEVLRRKGLIYQVYRAELGEPKLGHAQQERRAGLYADRAGELLGAEPRAMNPQGMFALDRNQIWLPDGVEPSLPEGLTARPRSNTAITAYRLNSRSGPGGTFQSYTELMPAPEAAPAPPVAEAAPQEPDRPAPAAEAGTAAEAGATEVAAAEKPARGNRRRRTSQRQEEPAAEADGQTSAGGEAAPRPDGAAANGPAAPVSAQENGGSTAKDLPAQAPGGRVLPQEKLSGRKARPAPPAPPTGNGAESQPVQPAPGEAAAVPPPRTGVEVVETELRNGVPYHTMRDLRNNSKVHNVTRYSARRLWYYAILRHESGPPKLEEITWSGNVGLWRKVYRAGTTRYDLVSRDPDGTLHVYYGVTEEGIDGPWRGLDLNAGETEHEEEGQDWS